VAIHPAAKKHFPIKSGKILAALDYQGGAAGLDGIKNEMPLAKPLGGIFLKVDREQAYRVG